MIILCVSIENSFDDYGMLCDILNNVTFNELASVEHKLLTRYSKENNKPYQEFKINWGDLTAKDAVIKNNKFGKPYNYNAPNDAASKCVDYSTHIIKLGKGNFNLNKLSEKNSLQEIEIENKSQQTNTKKRYQF